MFTRPVVVNSYILSGSRGKHSARDGTDMAETAVGKKKARNGARRRLRARFAIYFGSAVVFWTLPIAESSGTRLSEFCASQSPQNKCVGVNKTDGYRVACSGGFHEDYLPEEWVRRSGWYTFWSGWWLAVRNNFQTLEINDVLSKTEVPELFTDSAPVFDHFIFIFDGRPCTHMTCIFFFSITLRNSREKYILRYLDNCV